MTDLPPCQAASELRRLTDAALSAVAPDGAVLRHLHLDGGKLTLIDESGAPAWSGGLDAYRRIRNTCRYLLGNLKDVAKADLVDVKDMDPLDRYALDVAARTHQRVQDAYRDYEFHKVFHSLHNLCSTDLSAFYLDILKDRLYCEEKDGLRRRSAQSALFLILDAMAKLFAPILAFTCDEIWQSMPHRASDDARNVLLNQMPEGFAQYALEDAAMEKWDVVMKLRQDVNGVLEKARADKRIGKALEAHVTLATEDAAIRSACEGVNLAEVCIVSDCVWAQPEEGAEVGTGVNYPNLTIGVSEAKGTKCPRCWKHSTQADENGLCPRCASVIAKCADFGEV